MGWATPRVVARPPLLGPLGILSDGIIARAIASRMSTIVATWLMLLVSWRACLLVEGPPLRKF